MSARLTIEEAERRWPDMIQGQVWKCVDTKYWFICETHEKYEQIYFTHNDGHGCPKCGREKTGVAKRLTIKQAEARWPDMVKSQTWTTNSTKYRFVCETHGEYEQKYNNHDNGQSCPKCGRENIAKAQSLNIEEAEARCSDMIRGQVWEGSKAKYRFVCDKHGEYEQIYSDHNGDHSCKKCGYERIGEKSSLAIEEVEHRNPDMVKGQVWKGNHVKYQFICDTHGKYEQEYNNHARGAGCLKCGRENAAKVHSLTIEEAEARCPDMVRGQAWKGNHVKYQFLCPKHGEYKQGYDSHATNGAGCPICRESHGEKTVAKVLTALKIPFKRQKRFDSCRNIKPLPFDFYLAESKTLIEFHGRQHYHLARWSERVSAEQIKREFEELQRHDRIKKAWAGRNGYTLIVVPYTIKNVASFLEDMLLS